MPRRKKVFAETAIVEKLMSSYGIVLLYLLDHYALFSTEVGIESKCRFVSCRIKKGSEFE